MGLALGFFALPAQDLAASQRFYAEVMGWSFAPRDAGFAYIQSDGEMLGALERATADFAPASQGPKLYFRAEQLAATLAKVAPAGGKVTVAATPIMGGERGYSAEIHDPSGNRVAFWAPTL
jgi:predicted enzyme related to lactoylglutathione lyase